MDSNGHLDLVSVLPPDQEIDSVPAPWERQPGEKERQYACFREFLLLGKGRRLTVSYVRSGYSYEYSRQLFHDWRWAERAEAYDRFEDDKIRQELLDGRKVVRSSEWDDYFELLEEWRLLWGRRGESAPISRAELEQFVKLRSMISDFGRRAVGLPLQIAINENSDTVVIQPSSQLTAEKLREIDRELDGLYHQLIAGTSHDDSSPD